MTPYFPGVTVTGTGTTVGLPIAPFQQINVTDTFTVNFPTAEPGIQYVPGALLVSFSNPTEASTLSGFLPSVTVSTLDKPFTINNIPYSQTNPTLTAEAIVRAFQAQVHSFSTGVAPVSFISTATQFPYPPPPAAAAGGRRRAKNPYTVAVSTIMSAPPIQPTRP